jgi:biopolymer transport protein ExbB
MYPLLACSILALAVVLERMVFFFRSRQSLDTFLLAIGFGEAGPGYAKNGLAEKIAAQDSRGCLTRLAKVCLACAGDDPATAEEKIFVAGSELVREAEKGLALLAAIGHIAPLMGLFGTVLGMIGVFRQLEAAGGRADITLLSGGIWVALLTTAFGLLVAIPAVIAYKYFSGLAGKRAEDMHLLASRLKTVS